MKTNYIILVYQLKLEEINMLAEEVSDERLFHAQIGHPGTDKLKRLQKLLRDKLSFLKKFWLSQSLKSRCYIMIVAQPGEPERINFLKAAVFC